MSSWHGGLCHSWNNSGNLLAKQELRCSTEAEKATRGSESEPRTAFLQSRNTTNPNLRTRDSGWFLNGGQSSLCDSGAREGVAGRYLLSLQPLHAPKIWKNSWFYAELLSRWEVCFGGFVDICNIHLLNAVEACIIFSTQPNFIIDVYFLFSNIPKIWSSSCYSKVQQTEAETKMFN